MNKHARALTCSLTCCRLRDRCRYAVGVSFVTDELTQMVTPPHSPAHAQQNTVEHTSYQLYAAFPEFHNAFLVDPSYRRGESYYWGGSRWRESSSSMAWICGSTKRSTAACTRGRCAARAKHTR